MRTALVGLALVLVFLLYVALFVTATPMVRAAAGALVALPGAAVVLASARRRLNDSARPGTLAFVLLALWLAMAAAQLAAPFTGLAMVLAGLFALAVLALAALPESRLRARYAPGSEGHLGYSGPVDLSPLAAEPVSARQRVEPSMDGSEPTMTPLNPESTLDELYEAAESTNSYWDDEPKGPRLGETVGRLGNQLVPLIKRQSKALGAIGAAVVLGVLVLTFWPQTQSEQQTVEVPKPALKPTAPEFQHSVAMPDTYELLMNHDGLIIKWPGSRATQGELWSQLTAQGDRSCAEMRFNNNNRYRPIKVEVWPDDIYYAYFSPLDTADIVYDAAMRGNFRLCGYDFGLSGSMDTLRAHPAFALYTRR
ncbi:hypothetical protein [Ferrimonas balearica]|uniref:hypothetical protein n=1 Tax=Ferrimonas balearica TaxID=44012 RepID=UPI001C991019|nr:hypothetical protein [Ferrimonas balearica]MBY5920255.1 hypothetical protein [Ferrimonas balearica]MBY5997060.1 hypothetical protein [Ferrimonas balearica]